MAQDSFSDSHAYCGAGDQCYDRGIELRQDASAHATRATVFSTVGAVALVSCVVLWLVAPDAQRERARPQLAKQ